ncbi:MULTISPECIES: alpha/beta fold hydrolase [unclassified Streptomyces]|uniref:alpha/beta hydrolase family protein n=1 Tax=unclassified Streptomyces TaxID=2593676 RepID=UPI0003800719|nr:MULTISPECIES: alpha/beta fold hydrolase [unclassified Streptomyces]MYX36201.1 alpha/beta fold hydrolase [Streptomyces sp. SID8377]
MRLTTAAALAATTAFGAGAAAVAAGRHVSELALRPSASGVDPDPLTVHAVTGQDITLTRTLGTVRRGVHGLIAAGVHVTVGEVLSTAPDSVTRRLVRINRGGVAPGDTLRLTPQVHTGTPGSALGLEYRDAEIPAELGLLPAWFVPGARDTWVVLAHGLGTSRELGMNLMAFLAKLRLPVLAFSYRNDAGAPPSWDGIGHLGDSEWRDLDAAMRYAVRHGARRLVLHGWSTGATMALRATSHSPLRALVSGMVLDSPVLDWQDTVRAAAAARGAPRALLPLGVRATEGRTGLHAERIAEAAHPERLDVPALVFHGPDDTLAPWGPSRQLARQRPDLVTLHAVSGASHAAMWNANPSTYEEALRRFLTPLL